MRRVILALPVIAAITWAALPSSVEAAPTGVPVVIVAHTSFETAESAFESSLPGCEEGTVVNGDGGPHFTPWGGVFNGDKEFTCAGGESGFTIRLKAQFGEGGSTGHWVVVDAWGELAGLKGSGSLVGIPISDTIIDDVYTGTVR